MTEITESVAQTMIAERPTIRHYESPVGRMLNRTLHAKWVAELRSGERKQATGVLKTVEAEPGFCCLGLYCEITGIPQIVAQREVRFSPMMEPELIDITVFGAAEGYQGSHAVIPRNYGIHLDKGGPNASWFGNPEFIFGSEGIFEIEIQGKKSEQDYYKSLALGAERPRMKFSLPDLNDGGFTFPQIADVIDYFL